MRGFAAPPALAAVRAAQGGGKEGFEGGRKAWPRLKFPRAVDDNAREWERIDGPAGMVPPAIAPEAQREAQTRTSGTMQTTEE